MSFLKDAGRSVRTAVGPFGIGSEVQMMRISLILSMPLFTMARRLPRVNPSLFSPCPEDHVMAPSYWRWSTATTPCSCPPANPVRLKNSPGSGLTPMRRRAKRGIR